MSELSLSEIASEAEDEEGMGEEEAQKERIVHLLEALKTGLPASRRRLRARRERDALPGRDEADRRRYKLQQEDSGADKEQDGDTSVERIEKIEGEIERLVPGGQGRRGQET